MEKEGGGRADEHGRKRVDRNQRSEMRRQPVERKKIVKSSLSHHQKRRWTKDAARDTRQRNTLESGMKWDRRKVSRALRETLKEAAFRITQKPSPHSPAVASWLTPGQRIQTLLSFIFTHISAHWTWNVKVKSLFRTEKGFCLGSARLKLSLTWSKLEEKEILSRSVNNESTHSCGVNSPKWTGRVTMWLPGRKPFLLSNCRLLEIKPAVKQSFEGVCPYDYDNRDSYQSCHTPKFVL